MPSFTHPAILPTQLMTCLHTMTENSSSPRRRVAGLASGQKSVMDVLARAVRPGQQPLQANGEPSVAKLEKVDGMAAEQQVSVLLAQQKKHTQASLVKLMNNYHTPGAAPASPAPVCVLVYVGADKFHSALSTTSHTTKFTHITATYWPSYGRHQPWDVGRSESHCVRGDDTRLE